MRELISQDAINQLSQKYQDRFKYISERMEDIDRLMSPCSKQDTLDALLRLQSQLRHQPDMKPAEVANGYKTACEQLPAWAISEAVNDYLNGQVQNHTGQYIPTCAEFAIRVRHILLPFAKEQWALHSEAEKMVDRWKDEHRRLEIEKCRRDPAVQARITALLDCVRPEIGKLPSSKPCAGKRISSDVVSEIEQRERIPVPGYKPMKRKR